MSLTNRVITNLKTRRDKVLRGEINSIPSPFDRFTEDFLGIEQAKFYLLTASTKVGKTAFSSYLFLYTPLFYAYEHPEVMRLKIFYYPLEETPEDVLERFMCYVLYKLSNGRIIVSRNDLKSSNNTPISKEILDLLESEEYKNILDFFDKTVVFSSTSNATGLWKEMIRYAEDNGTIYKKKIQIKDDFGESKEIEAFDHYEPNDPNEYRIIFYDHLALISTQQGMTTKQCMDKLGEYFVALRNKYKYTICCIQQQSTASESLDAVKMNRAKASINNLGDSSYSARNCDVCIGVNSPFRQQVPEWNGYNITKLKDSFRYIEILLNRSGSAGGMLPLFYLGKVNEWKEMPQVNDTVNMNRMYSYVDYIRNPNKSNSLFFSFSKNYNNKFGCKGIIKYLCSLFNRNRK